MNLMNLIAKGRREIYISWRRSSGNPSTPILRRQRHRVCTFPQSLPSLEACLTLGRDALFERCGGGPGRRHFVISVEEMSFCGLGDMRYISNVPVHSPATAHYPRSAKGRNPFLYLEYGKQWNPQYRESQQPRTLTLVSLQSPKDCFICCAPSEANEGSSSSSFIGQKDV